LVTIDHRTNGSNETSVGIARSTYRLGIGHDGGMHPIERLRYVARASEDAAPSLLVREAAGALASFSSDPAALVTACRRLVDRQPQVASIWWLASRVLGAPEPAHEAWLAADEFENDTTSERLIEFFPEDATVLVLGLPSLVGPAIAKRGDLDLLVLDANGEGHPLVRRLERFGTEATLVDERGVGAAAAAADFVVLEANGLGTTGITAVVGSLAAAATAKAIGKQVIAAVGVGRVLPKRIWEAYLARLDDLSDPWDSDIDVVPAALIDLVIGPNGQQSFVDATKRADCPIAPELLKNLN
jgi:hypothetical protein